MKPRPDIIQKKKNKSCLNSFLMIYTIELYMKQVAGYDRTNYLFILRNTIERYL